MEVLPWIPSPSRQKEIRSEGPGSDKNSCHSDTSSSLRERNAKLSHRTEGVKAAAISQELILQTLHEQQAEHEVRSIVLSIRIRYLIKLSQF